MNETIKADVDAKDTNCRCCGDTLDSKGSQLCGQCEAEGCDPSTKLCLRELGDL